MKQVILACVVASMMAMPAVPQSAAPGKLYRITGTAVNQATGQPLSRVRVLMHPAGDDSKQTDFVTAADGRFTFEGLSAGMWSLYAERKGFVRQGFGERPGVPDSFTQVVTGSGGVSEDLTFPLYPPAAINGKVTDEAGEPVIAAIQVIIQLETGKTRFQRIRNVPTDELGEFRIWDMPAVPCYLLAITATPPPSLSDQPPTTFAPTYYSNTTDSRTATLLDLKPGKEYQADFTLKRSRGVTLTLEGDARFEVAMLSAAGPQQAEVPVAQLTPAEGLSFYNIPAGQYTLVLYDSRTGQQSSKTVKVGTNDLRIALPFSESPAIHAKVSLVDGDPGLLSKVTFMAHADGDYQTHARTVGADGTLTMSGMASGSYKFMLATRGVYVKSATAENTRIVDRVVEVPEAGTVELKVVLGGDGGKISGHLRANGKPVAPARVVLAPRIDSTNSADYRSYQTETDGSFSYPDIKPGDYILFATTDWRLEFGNPSAIRKYLVGGKTVHVEPKGSVDVDLELQQP